MGAWIRGSSVVGGKDGEFHTLVHRVLVAFDEPDIAGAKHGIGGGEEVGAKGGKGGEGGIYLGEQRAGDVDRFGSLVSREIS